jgi:hypothetical protein
MPNPQRSAYTKEQAESIAAMMRGYGAKKVSIRKVPSGYYQVTYAHYNDQGRKFNPQARRSMKRTKQNPGGGSGIILLIGAAGLAYWWYTSSTATAASSSLPSGVPSTAVSYLPAGGGTAAAPKLYDAYLDVNGNVVAVYGNGGWAAYTGATLTSAAYQQLLSNSAAQAAGAAAGTTATTPVSSSTSTASSSTPNQTAAAAPMSLATLSANLIKTLTAANDPAVTGTSPNFVASPFVFNYYLSDASVNGNSSTIPASVDAAPLATMFPGVTLTNAMPLSTYWAAMSAYLGTSLGMSGLRGFGGLGRARSPLSVRRGRWHV